MMNLDPDTYPELTPVQRAIAIAIQTGIIQPYIGETIHTIPGDHTQGAYFSGNISLPIKWQKIEDVWIGTTPGRGILVDENG
jgi:hypothetical protein